MRAVLWDLLLLCLFAHVLGDCQRDCLSCDRHAYSQWDGFNVLGHTYYTCLPTCTVHIWPHALCMPSPMCTARGVQKRYGGFIGVRKSARKWNNQKRFSEFLKQYLGMSPRSSEYDIAADLNEHNEI
nr:prepronociceptin [Dromaius novaehollandiae]